MKIKKMAIYARQSRQKETNGSIEDQISRGISKARELKKDYVIYEDRGLTAAVDHYNNRPGFQKLIDDVKRGLFDSVFVIDHSRITRSPIVEYVVREIFKQNQVIIHSSLEGTIDLQNSSSEMLASLFSIMNRKQVKDNTEKMKAVLENRARNGKAHTSAMKPYGYRADEEKNLIVDEEESVIIKRIFDYRLNGYGTGKIADILNQENIPTRGQKALTNGITRNKGEIDEYVVPSENLAWRGNTILSILKNPLYKGVRIYKGFEINAPKIVDGLTWDNTQSCIKNSRNRQGDIKHQYLLKNLCKCGICGKNIVGKTRESKRDHYYYCTSKLSGNKCGLRSINISYLEEVVWYAVINSSHIQEVVLEEIEKLKNPEHLNKLKKEIEGLENSITRLKERKKRTVNVYEFGIIGDDELKQKLEEYDTILKELNQKRINLIQQVNDSDDYIKSINTIISFQSIVEKLKDEADFETKRKLVNMFIEKIVIDFDSKEEVYSINLWIKLPKFHFENGDSVYGEIGGKNVKINNELHTFSLSKGQKPNLLNYDPEIDKFFTKNEELGTNPFYEKFEKDGKVMFRNRVGRTVDKSPLLPHSYLGNSMMGRPIGSFGHQRIRSR